MSDFRRTVRPEQEPKDTSVLFHVITLVISQYYKYTTKSLTYDLYENICILIEFSFVFCRK